MRSISLPSYEIYIASGLLSRVADITRGAAPAHRYAIITDTNVGPIYASHLGPQLGEDATAFTFKAGEESKTRDVWARITDEMLDCGMGRDAAIIALGGGVVGDVAGFVAATFMRGIPYVQVPTTLLSMIDSSVGGKTAVDTPVGKNLVGAFHQPAAVVVDPRALLTLPERQLRSGLAEAIKHGVVADEKYFETVLDVLPNLFQKPDGDEMLALIEGSVAIKASVVRRDERESGVRKILNFGHTIGHAVESATGFQMLHGEAVAVGMVVESDLAERAGIARTGTADRVLDAVTRAGLPTTIPSSADTELLMRAIRADKKTRAGLVNLALPETIGTMAADSSAWTVSVDDATLRSTLEHAKTK
ncbi:MAG: 3-dehydroquinate synthase [Gemmatimonadaceae bacterium]